MASLRRLLPLVVAQTQLPRCRGVGRSTGAGGGGNFNPILGNLLGEGEGEDGSTSEDPTAVAGGKPTSLEGGLWCVCVGVCVCVCVCVGACVCVYICSIRCLYIYIYLTFCNKI